MADLARFRIGLVQMTVGEDKAANFARAANLVREAARNGAQLVALPVSLRSVAIAIWLYTDLYYVHDYAT